MSLRVANVVGARPNFMKIAPLMAAYKKWPDKFDPILVHTGQHYDERMSRCFFEELGLPAPDVDLGVGSGTHAEQTGGVMVEMERLLARDRPDLVVVVGDVNSTLATALVAAKLCIPLAHVEAGLRSFDPTMPEEVNRRVTDALSDYCFTTDEEAGKNLLHEGVPEERIFLVGNVMIDTLLRLKKASEKSTIRDRLGLCGRYGVVTLHRPENVDVKETFSSILKALETLQDDLTLIFPIHPRTLARLQEFGFAEEMARWKHLRMTEPLSYLELLCLTSGASVVLTDSGGMQEETTVLGVPCLTIRRNTERPLTVTQGSNTLIAAEPATIIDETRKVLRGDGKQGSVPELWDGRAAERMVESILRHPPGHAR